MRKRSYHFKPEEIVRIRAAFDAGWHPEEIAGFLECSTRIINTYYRRFRGNVPAKRGRRKAAMPIRQQARRNLYVSSFEL